MRPVTLNDIVDLKRSQIPDEVIEIFNLDIALNWDGYQSKVMVNEIAQEIAKKLEMDIFDVYEKKYLNIEPIFNKK